MDPVIEVTKPTTMAPAEPDPVTVRETLIPHRSTLATVLSRFDFTPSEIYRLVQDTRSVYDLSRIRAGNRLVLKHSADGSFQSFRYDIDDEEYLEVHRDQDRYVALRNKQTFQLEDKEIFGQIQTSLWDTLISQGEKASLVDKLWKVLLWDISFTEIQPQDSFRLLVEKKYLEDRFVKYGDLQAVRFDHKKKTYFGFLFEDPETGKKDYFDKEGKSVRKAFLKVPFNFDPRITSGFSYSRFHPILKRRRPHLGIDYGAPSGTRVLSAGNGTVVFSGRKGGYGKMVKIRHSQYTTSYAHLSRIHVRRGQKVDQGQVIGRVGSTGLSTGPHLDYRIQNKKGKYLNPSNLSFPPQKPVNPKHFDSFRAIRDALIQRLESIPEHASYLNRNAISS